MKKLLPASWFVCKHCLHCVGSFALWTTWLLLAISFAFLLKIALSRELIVPAWLVHRLENKHAARGLITHFGAVNIDPHGRILLTDARLHSVKYPEPLLIARNIELTLDPWAVIAGDFAANEIHIRGARLQLPPILSPSGLEEPILTDLDVSLEIDDRDLTLNRFTARYSGLTINAHGTITIPRTKPEPHVEPAEIIDVIIKAYVNVAQQLAAHAPKTAWFENPHLELTLDAHPDRAAIARAQFTASSARLSASLVPKLPPSEFIDLGPLSLSATVPLVSHQAWITRIQASVATLSAPDALQINDARLSLLTSLQPGWKPTPRSLDLALGRVNVRDLSASSVSARLTGSAPRIQSDIAFRLLDEPWSLAANVDLSERSGTLSLSSKITPAVIALAGRRVGRDLPAIIKPAVPAPFKVDASLAPGWKLERARGRFSSGPVNVRRVAITATAAEFTYAGSDLMVDRILLRTPESEARGSYQMDTRTNDFRFLLEGALRPPDIAGWFSEWWPNFWKSFDFSASSPPRASIEISGRWGRPYDTLVFLHADATRPVIRTVPYDHVRTTLFIRPHFYDGLELVASRGGGGARGTFTRRVDFAKNTLDYQTFDVVSDLDLNEDARMLGTLGTDIVEPFTFKTFPKVTAVGRLTGPASTEGAHDRIKVKIDSSGPFTFMGFPLSNLSTDAFVDDSDLKLENLRVGFAKGYVTGRARLSGRGDQRRLGFDASLEGSSLGESIQTLEEFGAFRKKLATSPGPSKFQQRVAAGRLNLRLSGDGNYRDPYSFIGSGSGEISGAELAQINLLGGLSDVLRAVRLDFTSLSLNSAQANFKLDGRQLDFSEFKITGPTAAIDLTGIYRLDLQQMNFNARVSPFELSRNPLASAVDLVLTPFSNILELKLTGNLDKPRWRFAYGPSSLLRSLTGKKDSVETPSSAQPTTPSPATLQPPPFLRRR